MELLKRIYDCFNARDMETVLAALHEDVNWANGMEAGDIHRAKKYSYWNPAIQRKITRKSLENRAHPSTTS